MKASMRVVCLLVLAAVAGCAQTAKDACGRKSDLADNAALKYWIAFASMPELTDQEGEAVSLAGQWAVGEAAAAAVKRCEVALNLLNRAVQVRRCEWGIIKEGPATLLPHLDKARQIARLACLRARLRAAEKDGEGATKDALAVFTLSRHCNTDCNMISTMTRLGIEKYAADAAADILMRLDRNQVQRLADGLDALPESRGYREAVLGERDDVLGWFLDALKQKGSKGEEAVKVLGLQKEQLTEEMMAGYIRELEKSKEYYTLCADMAPLPLAEFDRQVRTMETKTKQECPTFSLLLPAFGRIRHEEAASEARMAMLRAAIAIALEGPDKLKDFKDPFGDGPFEYREIGKGFELKSKLRQRDMPVTLTVPGPD